MNKYPAQKGSISIYLLLTLMLILAVIFTLLESLRAEHLQLLAKENADQVMESVFAQYDKEIFEQYQIFFYELQWDGKADFSSVYDTADEIASAAFQPHSFVQNAFMYRGKLSDVKVGRYGLATDGGGSAFVKQAAACAKCKAPTDAIEGVAALAEEAGRQEGQADKLSDIENSALEALEETEKENGTKNGDFSEQGTVNSIPAGAGSEQTSAGSGSASAGSEQASTGPEPDRTLVKEYGNPIESMKNIKKSGVLSLVVNPEKEISTAALTKETMLTKRTLHTGTALEEDINITDQIWFLRYINQYFSNYGNEAGNALAYEKEFLVAGKNTDLANLKAVVSRLLLLREACNYASIQKDAEKCKLALSIATAICGVTGTSILTAAVQQGILLAWAYGESILDVRTLLEGGKIAFFKTGSEWTLEPGQLTQMNTLWLTAKECKNGMDYASYLNLFLLLQPVKTVAMRSLALMEANIQKLDGKENLQMDHMVCAMDCTFTYEAKPLFLQLVPQLRNTISGYYMVEKGTYSYCSE